MMRIGVISDTHGLLREEVLEILRGCDCILHGGDINNQGVLDTLGEIAPVYVVRGNNDKAWAEQLPHDLTVQMEGWKIFMVHNRKEMENLPEDADIVIFGHSHKYFEQVIDGRLREFYIMERTTFNIWKAICLCAKLLCCRNCIIAQLML